MVRPSLLAAALVTALLAVVPGTLAQQTIQWPFCYSFTGGIGDGSHDGRTYSISASGVITTAATPIVIGTQTAYSIVRITGARTYVDESGANYPANFVNISAGYLYDTYPYVSQTGVNVTLDSFVWNFHGNSSAKTATLIIDSSLMFDEIVVDGVTGAISREVVGNINVVQGTANASSLACNFTAGPSDVFNFCYGMSGVGVSGAPWSISTYGQFIATGPVLRHGMLAYTMQSMTGVRTYSNSSLNQSTNIIHIIYINGEEEYSHSCILNDNLIFVSPVELDYYGVSYTTLLAPVFPDQPLLTDLFDINLSMSTETKFYEWPVSTDCYANGAESDTALNYFNYSLASAGSFQCAVPVPAMQTHYFCYGIGGSDYTIIASGLVTVYGTPVSYNGRTGYSIANITGTRTFTLNGQSWTSQFVGSSADSFGAINNTYSQLFYTDAPHIDAMGILILVSSGTITPTGSVYGAPVIDLGLVNGQVIEHAYTTSGQFSSATGSLTANATSAPHCSAQMTGNSAAAQSLSAVIAVVALVAAAIALMA